MWTGSWRMRTTSDEMAGWIGRFRSRREEMRTGVRLFSCRVYRMDSVRQQMRWSRFRGINAADDN
jgi:hypothetical protein